MAIEMRERMKFLRNKWEEQGISKSLEIRIGINTGFCNVGNFGSKDRLDYTIIGGEVNLASRLESNAEVGQILISHETYALIRKDILCKKKEEITVKGISHKIQTYQVIKRQNVLNTRKQLFNEKYKGFDLSIDLSQLSKEQALKSLNKILSKIKKNI